MEALGVTPDQVAAAVGNENQDLPVGAIRRRRRTGGADVGAHGAAEDFGKIIVTRKGTAASGGVPVRVARWRGSRTGPRSWTAWRSTTASDAGR